MEQVKGDSSQHGGKAREALKLETQPQVRSFIHPTFSCLDGRVNEQIGKMRVNREKLVMSSVNQVTMGLPAELG